MCLNSDMKQFGVGSFGTAFFDCEKARFAEMDRIKNMAKGRKKFRIFNFRIWFVWEMLNLTNRVFVSYGEQNIN